MVSHDLGLVQPSMKIDNLLHSLTKLMVSNDLGLVQPSIKIDNLLHTLTKIMASLDLGLVQPSINPINTGLFCLVVALGGGVFSTPLL